MPLRVAFFGTPAFAVATLDRLLTSPHLVVAVVTQPDRPRGRGHALSPSPVKARALSANVPTLQPQRLDRQAVGPELQAHAPDIAVVAAYGKILPQWLIDLPRLGTINVHASLLPRWRGAAPVHRAVLAGDAETGVTIMRIVLALDAGPMLARARTPIDPLETSADLEGRLATIGAALLMDTIDRLAQGPVPEEAQDDRLATFAPRLERRERQVAWDRPAEEIHNQIRGLHPWPLAAALLNGQRLILFRSAPASADSTNALPGTIVRVERDALIAAAQPGMLGITTVQPEGRPPMAVRDYLNGRRVTAGDRFEPLPE